MLKRILALALALLLAVTVLAGCGQRKVTVYDVKDEFGKGFISYPIDTDTVVSHFTWVNGNVSKTCVSNADTEAYKDMVKMTGIEVDFIEPTGAQYDESFNLLFSSADLPDIIGNNRWHEFVDGGPDGAIESGYIMDLTDYAEDYLPHYYNDLKADEMRWKDALSLKGRLYSVGTMNHPETVYGIIVRQDWLDQLGMETPETIPEIYEVLKAFKEKLGVKAPFSFSVGGFYHQNILENGYNTSSSIYVDNGTVKYGPMTEEYKAYITEMAKWFAEGLIDPNIASNDAAILDAQVLNGETGMTFGYVASGMGKWMSAIRASGKDIRLSPVPYPAAVKGGPRYRAGWSSSLFTPYGAIASTSPNKEVALRLLDFGYTDEGKMLYRYGREGESYYIDDNGEPQFTENMINNPNGLTLAVAISVYTPWMMPSVATSESFRKQLTVPEQFEALDVWKSDESRCTPRYFLTDEEKEENASITPDVTTFVKETCLNVIYGRAPISALDELAPRIKELGMEKVIENHQRAYDRVYK